MAGVSPVPALDVACVVLCRTQPREQYWAQDYQVYLSEDKHVPRRRVEAGLEPDGAALYTAQEQTGLKGNMALQLAVYGRPSSSAQHTVTLLYAVPVALSEGSGSDIKFHSLASVMEDPHIDSQDRDMMYAVDQWLRERHALPFIDPSLMFLGEREGGVVKAIIENPIFSCQVPPPEDQLVISLNNPAFSAGHSTPDLHATQA